MLLPENLRCDNQLKQHLDLVNCFLSPYSEITFHIKNAFYFRLSGNVRVAHSFPK